jgi:hypothetical protein
MNSDFATTPPNKTSGAPKHASDVFRNSPHLASKCSSTPPLVRAQTPTAHPAPSLDPGKHPTQNSPVIQSGGTSTLTISIARCGTLGNNSRPPHGVTKAGSD